MGLSKHILKLTHVNDIQNLYENIDESNQLLLSPNIKFKNLGGSWNAIQFMCSWQRKHQEVSIILNKQINVNTDRFAKNEVLLVAFYLAKEVLLNDENIRQDLLNKFTPFVQSMNPSSLNEYLHKKGPRFKFLFLHKTKNEFLRLFYDVNNKFEFKSKKEIEALIGAFLNAPAISKRKYGKNLSDIKEISYELLSNSDKHGRRKINQEEMPKNIRGFSVDVYAFTDITRKNFVKDQENYRNFLEGVKEVLVISIFDSGEGIVKKYIETINNKKEKDMSFKDKQDTLLEVFLPGKTSSKIPNSGMGLTYVENNIKKLKGLLSIKTSSLEYFLTPDENKKYKKKFYKCHSCAGTSIVMLIPLNFKV